MKTFIKVTEIWTPSKDGKFLVLDQGIYGEYEGFKKVSLDKTFAYHQGLPGATWAAGHPLVLTDFADSFFERTEAAHQAGLTCAISVPILSGDFLLAVVVFLCGDEQEHAGAIEIWSNDLDRSNELGVEDGYYGTLEYFEFVSRKTKIMKGFGLPGKVWETEKPMLMKDLGDSAAFVRGRDAKNAGITTGVALPLILHQEKVYILTLLSAQETPIAQRIQIWVPNEDRSRLYCQSAYGVEAEDLAFLFESKQFLRGEGVIGRVWLTGVPIIDETKFESKQNGAGTVSSLFAMPVIDKGYLSAVVCMLL